MLPPFCNPTPSPAENEKRQKDRPALASQLEAEPQWDPSQRRDGPLVITRRLIMTNND